MARWEYQIQVFELSDIDSITDELNEQGSNGWELVSVSPIIKRELRALLAIYKRRVIDIDEDIIL